MATFAEELGQAHMNLECKSQAGDFIMLSKRWRLKIWITTHCRRTPPSGWRR